METILRLENCQVRSAGNPKKSSLYFPSLSLSISPGLPAFVLLCWLLLSDHLSYFSFPTLPGFRLPSGYSRTSWKHIAQLSESSSKCPYCMGNSTHDFQLERREKSVAGAAAPRGGCCLWRLSPEEALGRMPQQGNRLFLTTLLYNPSFIYFSGFSPSALVSSLCFARSI